MGPFLVTVAILNTYLGWLPMLGAVLRWCLEKDLEIEFANNDQILHDLRGARYLGPCNMNVTNHSPDLTYRFRLHTSSIVIKKPVVPWFWFWKQPLVQFQANIWKGMPRAQVEDFDLPPQRCEEFLIEFDHDFPNTGISIPRHSEAVISMSMIGRIRKLERRFRWMDKVPSQ